MFTGAPSRAAAAVISCVLLSRRASRRNHECLHPTACPPCALDIIMRCRQDQHSPFTCGVGDDVRRCLLRRNGRNNSAGYLLGLDPRLGTLIHPLTRAPTACRARRAWGTRRPRPQHALQTGHSPSAEGLAPARLNPRAVKERRFKQLRSTTLAPCEMCSRCLLVHVPLGIARVPLCIHQLTRGALGLLQQGPLHADKRQIKLRPRRILAQAVVWGRR